MKTTITAEDLKTKGACQKGVEWFETTFPSGETTGEELICRIERADWLIWGLAHLRPGGLDHQQAVTLACICARFALRHVDKGEDRPRLAIEAAERWVKSPTEENRKTAGVAATDAARAAGVSAWAAAGAAGAAGAVAAWAAAEVAVEVAAEVAVEVAGAVGAADAARKEEHKKMCAAIRKQLKKWEGGENEDENDHSREIENERGLPGGGCLVQKDFSRRRQGGDNGGPNYRGMSAS